MAKKQDRPSMPVPPAILPSFERYALAKQIYDKAEARMEAENGVLKETLIDSFAESLSKLRCKPSNPRLIIYKDNKPDIEGLFQVQAKFYPQCDPECQGNAHEKLVSALMKAGLSADVADSLVTNEVACEDKTTIRPFMDLINGAPVEQQLAQRLMKLMLDNFSEDERKLLLQPVEKYEIKDGFFERLAMYVPSKEGILACIKVLRPVHFLSHLKVGVGDSPMGVLNRIYTYAKDLLFGTEQKAA
jgi:hypothetical protein